MPQTAAIDPGANTHTVPVFFCYEAKEADEVFLAGDFTDWYPIVMLKGWDGLWTVTMFVTHGRHEYKFLVDGQWECRAGHDHSYRDHNWPSPNTYGSLNQVLYVD